MATSVGCIGGGASGSSWIRSKDSKKKVGRNTDRTRVCCVSAATAGDPYKTLMIQPGASKSEVKKAFRRLALVYHPDVCRESNCTVQFQRISEAYDMVMGDNVRGESTRTYEPTYEPTYAPAYEPTYASTYEPTYSSTYEPMYEPTYSSTYQPMYEPTYVSTYEQSNAVTHQEKKGKNDEKMEMYDPDCDTGEEWMGYECAWVRDYSFIVDYDD